MDRTDREILKFLNQNARMTASAIASRVNLSVSAVTERIHKLEEQGVILGYSLHIDEKTMGHPIRAYLEVTLEAPHHADDFLRTVLVREEILRCDHLAGEFDFLLLAQAPNVDTIHQLHHTLKSLPGVKQIRVRFIMKTEKNRASSVFFPQEENT